MEWSKTLNAFWMGGGHAELIAWKGSHQVFVYPCEEYPQPPTQTIYHTKRIETLADFELAIEMGTWYDATYVKTEIVESTDEDGDIIAMEF